jgi:hypothetical protein
MGSRDAPDPIVTHEGMLAGTVTTADLVADCVYQGFLAPRRATPERGVVAPSGSVVGVLRAVDALEVLARRGH